MDTNAIKEKLLAAETRCNSWLADGNQYNEKGKADLADKCYEKSQFWLDRANTLRDRLLEVHGNNY